MRLLIALLATVGLMLTLHSFSASALELGDGLSYAYMAFMGLVSICVFGVYRYLVGFAQDTGFLYGALSLKESSDDRL